MTKSVRPQKLPSLDGWRAVSIALVLLCHSTVTSGFPAKPPSGIFYLSEAVGLWGVRFFFVISGFLITHLLLQEREKCGFIDLKKFYARRALRILPVCFVYLFVVGFFTRYSQSATHWLANLTFTTNFFPIFAQNPTGHLWSLGVEEQFYIIWPCLLVFTLNRPQGISQLVKILLLPLILAPTVRLLYYEHLYPEVMQAVFYNFSFFTKFDSLAYGCLAAILFNYWRSSLERFCRRKFLPACLGALFVLTPCYLPFHGRFQAAGFESLQAMGISLLLLQSILNPGRGINRVLNWRWVSYIGILSYSIYIWQQLFCCKGEMDFGIKDPWWLGFPAWIFVSLLAATCSYHLLEKPLLNLRAKFKAI